MHCVWSPLEAVLHLAGSLREALLERSVTLKFAIKLLCNVCRRLHRFVDGPAGKVCSGCYLRHVEAFVKTLILLRQCSAARTFLTKAFKMGIDLHLGQIST